MIAKGVRDLIADKLFTMTPNLSGQIKKNLQVDMGSGNILEVSITFKPKALPKEEAEEVKMEEAADKAIAAARDEDEERAPHEINMQTAFELEPDEVEDEEIE